MKYPAVYEMYRDGWNSYFELYIYKTVKAMRKGIAKEPFFCSDSGDKLGIVTPVSKINAETGQRPLLFAHVALNEENLDIGVVTHECLHIAMAHERMQMCGMYYGEQCVDDEERLAYLLTDIVRGVYNVLQENGHIKK